MRVIAAIVCLALLLVGSCRDRVTGAPPFTERHPPAETGQAGHGSLEAGASAGGASDGDAGGHAGERALPTPDRPKLVVCSRELPRSCQATGDSTLGVRLRGTVVTPSAVLTAGELALDASGTIHCAGCDCGADGGALVLACPDWVIAPGLINLHDHLGYAGTPPLPHPGELYEHRSDWRLGEHGHRALPFKGNATSAQVLAHELRHVMAGTTSIVGSGGRRGLLRNLELPDATEGLLPGRIDAETFPLDDASRSADSAACEFGSNPDTPLLASSFSAYVAHVGEGTNERARDELRCALGNLSLIGETTAVVHAMALTRSDAAKLVQRGASVVWSPRSNLDLYGQTAPVALLKSLGAHLALGTDWLASGSMNLLRELACAKHYDQTVLGGYFDDFELLQMVTEHAGWALGLERRLGSLQPGLPGDVAAFTARDDAYASVVDARPQDVRLVLRGGTPLYGASQLVSAFRDGQACAELEVCGAAQRVCTAETGLEWEVIRAAGEAVYPLFSCEAPADEPRCEAVVTRECPFAESHCAPAPPRPAELADADRDGVDDERDVCPRLLDDQSDTDGDGLGDGCDACPLANPGLLPCQRTIAELRAPGSRLRRGAGVRLVNVRVTALRLQGSKGFYLEDGDHADYSGIFAYTGSTTPQVRPGEIVDVLGYFDSYQGTDELLDVQLLTRRTPVSPYAPRAVELTDAAQGAARAGALQSLWLRVIDAEVTETNPDAPRDYDETALTGGLRLDDLLYPELDNAFPIGTRFASVQGIAGTSFGHPKLYPAGAADLQLY